MKESGFENNFFEKENQDFKENYDLVNAKILKFEGVGDMDVYNPSLPFEIDGKNYIAGRVEKRESHWKDDDYIPQTKFFIEKNGTWVLEKNAPTLPLEDPFISYVDNELILGGVEVFEESREKKFRTIFLKGEDIYNLEKFASGPDMMKDIRLIQMLDKKIGVFTRPQGGEHKRGRIGFTIINSLEELDNKDKILEAKIIRNNLKDNEGEGVGGAVLLESGKIGALAHLANIDGDNKRRYRATTFILNPFDFQIENFKIIATRSDFPKGEAKNPYLEDVMFPSGLKNLKNERCDFYTGLSDVDSGMGKIENPYNENFK